MTEPTPPRDDEQAAPKRVLGERYELDEVIGRGGMAEVWRARDLRLGRPVAVKRLRVDLAGDPTFQARFRREAQSAAGLNHPNIVSTYDTGEEPDPSGVNVPWIVMELVEGHTLRDLLREGRQIRPEMALKFSQGVLDALAYSHKAGIIHRDIKPANVMITPAGQVKVMDFGIARAVADTSATMTQTAAVIGTAQYLSPEQARGETVDNRSDVYAAGCLLYELLVGRPPFVGDSPVSVAYQHVRETPVPPSTLDPEITPQMDAIVLKSLAKSPGDRYQDAKQMRDDITRLLAGQEISAVPPLPASLPTPVAPATPTAVTQVIGSSPAEGDTMAGELLVDEDEADEPRRKRGWLTWLVIALLASLVALAGYGVWHFTRPAPNSGMVQVPSVEGFNETQATGMLKNAGFAVQAKHVNGKGDATKGQVVDQDPDGQTPALKGSTVTITVNDGPVTHTVPKGLVGLTEAEAKAKLVEAGFPADKIEVKQASAEQESKHPELTEGKVVVVDPAEGADVVAAEQTITLYLATGKSPVPNLVGMSLEDARKLGEAQGFKVEEGEPVDDDANVDKVAKQDPPNGELKRGETIWVRIGKAVTPVEPAKIQVPQLFGLTEAEAKAKLVEAGFTGNVEVAKRDVTDEAMNGKVLETAPSPGTNQSADQTVTIFVGNYVATQPSETPTAEQTSEAPSSTPSATSTQTQPQGNGPGNNNGKPGKKPS